MALRCVPVGVSYSSPLLPALIETLSEDRACVMQEKKQLEEEVGRLRTVALLASGIIPPDPSDEEPLQAVAGAAAPAPAPPAPGACSSEFAADTDRLFSVAAIQDDEQVDSAVEASMVTVQ